MQIENTAGGKEASERLKESESLKECVRTWKWSRVKVHSELGVPKGPSTVTATEMWGQLGGEGEEQHALRHVYKHKESERKAMLT